MKYKENCGIMDERRKGLKDVWNAFMCEGATFTTNDIPSHKIIYGEKIVSGKWEFIFAEARNGGKYPVIKHAQFNGWRN